MRTTITITRQRQTVDPGSPKHPAIDIRTEQGNSLVWLQLDSFGHTVCLGLEAPEVAAVINTLTLGLREIQPHRRGPRK